MTPVEARAQVLLVLSEALALPSDLLDNGHSFQEIGVDSVAVVDALFALEERLAITVDFNAAGAAASDMEGPVSQLIDRIAGMIPGTSG